MKSLNPTQKNTKRFGFYCFSFRASHLRNQPPDQIKYETSVKGFKNKTGKKTGKKSLAHAQSAGFKTGNLWHNNSYLLSIYYVIIITLF